MWEGTWCEGNEGEPTTALGGKGGHGRCPAPALCRCCPPTKRDCAVSNAFHTGGAPSRLAAGGRQRAEAFGPVAPACGMWRPPFPHLPRPPPPPPTHAHTPQTHTHFTEASLPYFDVAAVMFASDGDDGRVRRRHRRSSQRHGRQAGRVRHARLPRHPCKTRLGLVWWLACGRRWRQALWGGARGAGKAAQRGVAQNRLLSPTLRAAVRR